MKAGHVHCFRFEEPNGPVALGRCHCGETRRASNVFAHDRAERDAGDAEWQVSTARGRGRRREGTT